MADLDTAREHLTKVAEDAAQRADEATSRNNFTGAKQWVGVADAALAALARLATGDPGDPPAATD